jgi:hypothetical protein
VGGIKVKVEIKVEVEVEVLVKKIINCKLTITYYET